MYPPTLIPGRGKQTTPSKISSFFCHQRAEEFCFAAFANANTIFLVRSFWAQSWKGPLPLPGPPPHQVLQDGNVGRRPASVQQRLNESLVALPPFRNRFCLSSKPRFLPPPCGGRAKAEQCSELTNTFWPMNLNSTGSPHLQSVEGALGELASPAAEGPGPSFPFSKSGQNLTKRQRAITAACLPARPS